MNFSDIEDSVLEEKKRLNNFLSRFSKNSRILIILLISVFVIAISCSIWAKSPEYEVLYSNLSNENRNAVTSQLKKMKISYKFTDDLNQILVPKNQVYEIRTHISENHVFQNDDIGFELLDKERFGISQFNEQINYQRALEGELARTIQRINIIQNAKIHIALPKTSLFLKEQKKPSASVILNVRSGKMLSSNQISSILHLIARSVSDLSIENITIVDQFGTLLNGSSYLNNQQVNNAQFKYSEDVESHYRNKIKDILEPLFGIGNVDAQVTAQINFNVQENTQEKYLPNTNYKQQSIRSRQTNIHRQSIKDNLEKNMSDVFLSKHKNSSKKIISDNNQDFKNNHSSLNADINRDNTVNYELDHTISHTKQNVGEIKRLSAAVIINFTSKNHAQLIPLTEEQIKNIKSLVCEAIGYSKYRGDSVHIVNALFFKNHVKDPVQIVNLKTSQSSHILFSYVLWLLIFLFLCFLLKKYIFSNFKKNEKKDNIIAEKSSKIDSHKAENAIVQEKIKSTTLNTEQLIHKICNISNQNPRTIALIIRQWMSDKK
ncbi:MAG: flagellar M-ring protein FliF [Buchnera aphidicola (Pentalonia nigronervosa)]|jgi:flagellar M-ring protein FliF|uniref:Flagellar M-ring protein n=1 Tax=Buchnera aphidicola (Pentalonia nigronervosa) TaxID=1309793 RepID=A0A7H1AZB1_9GAMM|nr:MAG: flagellar M-ring protein FliF [Buchnera aphidicola (Pentalonia nigronervosa)]